MLSYIAHIPSSPVLLPNIGKHRFFNFQKTNNAIEMIAKDLESLKCETIITFTPNGDGQEKAYILNVSPKFDIKFDDFGDFQTSETVNGDSVIAYHIRHKLGTKHPISSITNPRLDISSNCAIMHLQSQKNKYNVLPITHALEPNDKLFEFGKSLRDVVENAENKIAVISLGDLSRPSQKYTKKAKELDQQLIQNLHDKDANTFIDHHPDKIHSFSISGFRPLAIVLGLLDGINYDFKLHCYEQKYGVGLMTAQFAL